MHRTIRAVMLLLVAAAWQTPSWLAVADAPGQPSYRFLEQIPADHKNVLLITDPLPFVHRLLHGSALRKTLAEGRIAATLRKIQADGAAPGDTSYPMAQALNGVDINQILDPRNAAQWIEARSKYVPNEMAVSASDKTWTAFSSLIRFALLKGLSSAADETGRTATDGVALRQEMQKTLEQFELPEIVVWLRLREPAERDMLFAQAKVLAVSLQALGMQATMEKDAIRVRSLLKDVVSEEILKVLLSSDDTEQSDAEETDSGEDEDSPSQEKKTESSKEDPQTQRLIAAAGAIKISITLERAADGLRLVVGSSPSPSTSGLATTELGPLWKPNNKLAAFAHWDISALKRGVGETVALWKKWEKTPAAGRMRQQDEEKLLDDLITIDRELSDSADDGSTRVTIGDAVEVDVHERGAPLATPLRETKILELIPANSEIVSIRGDASLADEISANVDNFEDRLARRSLSFRLNNRREQLEMTESIERQYYGEMADFRTLAQRTSFQIFAPPCASLITASGRIKQFDLRFEVPKDELNWIVVKDLPIVECAVLGRTRDAREGVEFVGDLWRAFLIGVTESDVIDQQTQLTKSIDLGLDVPTYGFETAWFERLSSKPKLAISGDVQPNFFQIGDYFVFSTSPRLSKAIVKASRQKNRFPLKGLPANMAPISYGIATGRSLATFVESAGGWIANWGNSESSPVSVEGPLFSDEMPEAYRAQMVRIGELVVGSSDVVRLLDRCQWHTVDEGKVRVTQLRVLLTPSANAAAK